MVCENVEQMRAALDRGAKGVEVRAKLIHQLGAGIKAQTEDDAVALSIEKNIRELKPNRLLVVLSRGVAERLVAENSVAVAEEATEVDQAEQLEESGEETAESESVG